MAEHLIEIGKAENDLLDCAAYVAENVKNTDGHAAAMAEIVPRYLEKGAVDLAAELANTVDDPFTRDRLLLRVAEKCAAVGDEDYAFQIIEAIEEGAARDEAREHIAAQKALKGDFAGAFEIAGTLPHADYAFAEIAVRQAASGEEADALATVEKIDFAGAKVSAFQTLALLKLEKGDSEKAVSMLDRAAEAANDIEFHEEQIRALTDIGSHYLEAKNNGKAIEIFDKAKASAETLDSIQKDSFLGSIALGFLQAGSLELADRALDLVNDNVQISSTLVGYAREFWRRGEKTEAVESLEEAYSILKSQRDKDIRDTPARVKLWAVIAVEFAQFEKPERAFEIAQEIPEENAHTSALAQTAQICIARNEDEWAKQAVNAIGDDSQKTLALLGVSDAANRAGKRDEAVALLNEAAVYAETVDRLGVRAEAFDELARRYHAFGDTEKMREMFYENLSTIIEIRSDSDRAAALAKMSEFYEANKLDLTDAEREMILRIIAKSNA